MSSSPYSDNQAIVIRQHHLELGDVPTSTTSTTRTIIAWTAPPTNDHEPDVSVALLLTSFEDQGGVLFDQKVLGFLVGQVMKASAGKANPKQVNQLLRQRIEEQS